jgi:prepilin-type N-terminal cleavage/methylation domain-containing protein
MNRTPRDQSSGFTLIEVLATMVLLGILLPVSMQAITACLRAAGSARHMTEAAGLAQAKLNELITTNQWTSAANGDFGQDHPGYRFETSNVARDYGLTELDLRVEWLERGLPRYVTVSTLVPTDTTTGTP